MNATRVRLRPLTAVVWWLVSVPIFIKILGIGLLVGGIFGGVILFRTSGTLSRTLLHSVEGRALSDARWLASSLERPMVAGDRLAVRELLARVRATSSDVRYAIVRDTDGKAVAHTFARGVPVDLDRRWRPVAGADASVRMLGSAEGLIIEARCAILGGNAGGLQYGLLEREIGTEVAALTRSVLLTLGFSMGLGSMLGLLLSHLFLTQPIYHLVRAAERVARGDFQARARAPSADELGQLGTAFNRMTESLVRYRAEVEEKEKARLALLDMLVQAQEDERKKIARELHDQLGQSLAALLLFIESGIPASDVPEKTRAELVGRLRELSAEVHRLAWGMRPSILDDYGIDKALARYVAEMAAASGVAIDYQYSSGPGLERLPDRTEIALYRIVQEAVTNIVSHSRAGHASIVVLHRPRGVTLVIEDDGRGFDVEEAMRGRRLGLTGMRERASLLGGECTIRSRPGEGATIRVMIPLGGGESCPSES
jgi:signal transduction histidine kinase